MTWIDEGLEKRKSAEKRESLIEPQAEKVFNLLWKEIVKCVEEAKGKGIPASTNGSPFDRTVFLEIPIPPKQGRDEERAELHICLLKPDEIKASAPSGTYSFRLDVCKDDVVCLKFDGREMEMQQAARHILEPFLFPEFA